MAADTRMVATGAVSTRSTAAWLTLLLLMASCSAPAPQRAPEPGVEPFPPYEPGDLERDRAPTRVPFDLSLLPDPVPKREPPSRYGNHSPYAVLGRTYEVLGTADGYSKTGVASWYGAKFHGRRTSSGEKYDMYKLTAAHRYLPIPNYARVTNLENGRSVTVRINDRGPFHSDRIIDLSYAAAVRLGFAEQGTARVRVEVVTPPDERPATVADAARGHDAIFLQAGAFSDRAAAQRLQASLSRLLEGSSPGRSGLVQVRNPSRDGLFRVWIGPIAQVAEAVRIQEIVAAADFAKPIVIRE
jgi:rare lipoprotein A